MLKSSNNSFQLRQIIFTGMAHVFKVTISKISYRKLEKVTICFEFVKIC